MVRRTFWALLAAALAAASLFQTDAAAYYPSAYEENFVPAHGPRLIDTRLRAAGALAPGETLVVPLGDVTERGSVAAYLLTVTAVSPTTGGYLSVYPSSASRPPTSSVNFAAGVTTASTVISHPGADNAVAVYNPAGRTHVIVDLKGVWSPGGLTAIVPERALDTRHTARLTPGETRTVDLAAVTSVPPDAAAVALTVTAIDGSGRGYLTVFPAGTQRPFVSNVNFAPRDTVANMVIVGLGAGKVDIYNAAGEVDVVVDVVAYFDSPPGFHPVSPFRIYDSRYTTPVAAGEYRRVLVNAPENVVALVVNVTALDADMDTFINVLAGQSTNHAGGTASVVNLQPGQVRSNLAIIPIGIYSDLVIFNSRGAAHVVLDVFGFMTETPA